MGMILALKYVMFKMKPEKRQDAEGIELKSQENITTLGERRTEIT